MENEIKSRDKRDSPSSHVPEKNSLKKDKK
jgi:hypothetical protein